MSIESRSYFLGAYVTGSVRVALQHEAERRGLSVSLLIQQLLARALRVPAGALAGPRPGRGRRPAQRGVLTGSFRAAILASRRTRADLARAGGFHPQALSTVLRDGEVILSVKTQSRLAEIARSIGYEGRLVA